MNIYTINEENKGYFRKLIPKERFAMVAQDGYFTLGALDDEREPLGVLQFYIGKPVAGVFSGEVKYLYSTDANRGKSVRSALLDKLMEILQNSGIPLCEILVPNNEAHDVLVRFFSAYGFIFPGITDSTTAEDKAVQRKLEQQKLVKGFMKLEPRFQGGING